MTLSEACSDAVAEAAASLPKRPASAPSARASPRAVPASWRDPSNRLFSSLTIKVSYWPGSVTTEYGRSYTPASARALLSARRADTLAAARAAGAPVVLPAAVEAVEAKPTEIAVLQEAVAAYRGGPVSANASNQPSVGVTPVEQPVADQAPLHFKPEHRIKSPQPPSQPSRRTPRRSKGRRFTAGDVSALKVQGKQMLPKRPASAPTHRASATGASSPQATSPLAARPPAQSGLRAHRPQRNLKPAQAKRPSSAPASGRRVDPYCRGLQSQLWVGMGHFPDGLQTTHQAQFYDFKLHPDTWAKVRNAEGSKHRRELDFNNTGPV